MNLKALVHRILEDYALPWDGTHGVSHWAKVLENGLRLAEVTGAKIEVVQLFAVFHDARRVNEGGDDNHGRRGAELAHELRDSLGLGDGDFDLLYDACVRHTDGETEADVTIQTCWDADRLDLGRVGICSHPKRPSVLTSSSGAMDERRSRRCQRWLQRNGQLSDAYRICEVAHGSPEYWETADLVVTSESQPRS